jgi:hydroxyacylglutathione hydrolase
MSAVDLVPLVDEGLGNAAYLIDSGDGRARVVLDVRQAPEFAAGHLPGATHVELGALAEPADELPASPTAVRCGHGESAMGAASPLEQASHRDLAVLRGGPDGWAEATDRSLKAGT